MVARVVTQVVGDEVEPVETAGDRLMVGIGEPNDGKVRATGLVRGTQVGGEYDDLVSAADEAFAGSGAELANAAALLTERG